jgi:hypothetical protein
MHKELKMTRTVTDEDILSDLEYRGIDAFLGEMATGLNVPECFAVRVFDIIRTAYDTELQCVAKTTTKRSGSFCLMPYTDQYIVTLVS